MFYNLLMLVVDGIQRRRQLEPLAIGTVRTVAAVLNPLTTTPSLDGICRFRPAASVAEPQIASAEAQPAPSLTDPIGAGTKPRWMYAALAGAIITPAVGLSIQTNAIRLANRSIPVAQVQVATPEPAPAAPDPAAAAVAAQSASLQQLLDGFTVAETASFGIVVKDLKTGAIASVNGEKVFTSASFYKLFVANQLYQAAAKGDLALTPQLINCMRIMINISDNDCGALLGDKLGWGRQDASLKTQGYSGTSLASLQKTTANDAALLMERIYRSENLAPEHAQQYMQFLKEQRVNNRLPKGLPAGTVFAHKTGDLFGYMHDGGIVFGPKTDYLVIVMSGPWTSPGQAPSRFADLSARLYAAFQN